MEVSELARRNKRGKSRRRGKQSLVQVAKKFTKLGAFFAPEAAVILQNGVSLESGLKALTLKSGFDVTNGTFDAMRGFQAWMPILMFEGLDRGQSMIRRLLSSV